MATISSFATAVAGTVGTWASTTNTTGANNGTVGTWTSTGSGAVASIDLGFGTAFASIPFGSTINSVQITVWQWVNNTSRMLAPQTTLFDGATQIGAFQNLGLTTTSGNNNTVTNTTTPTLAQVQSSTFRVRVQALKAASTQSGVQNLDAVQVVVTYTPLALADSAGVTDTVTASIGYNVNIRKPELSTSPITSGGYSSATSTVTATVSGLPGERAFVAIALPASQTITPPSGWTSGAGFDAVTPAGNFAIYWFNHVIASGDPATVDFALSSAASAGWVGFAYSYIPAGLLGTSGQSYSNDTTARSSFFISADPPTGSEAFGLVASGATVSASERFPSITNSPVGSSPRLALATGYTPQAYALHSLTPASAYTQTAARVAGSGDGVDITDDVSAVVTASDPSIYDSVGVTDSALDALGSQRTAADPVGVSDSVSVVRDLRTAPADPVGVADSITSAASVARALNDAAGITDSVSAVLTSSSVQTIFDRTDYGLTLGSDGTRLYTLTTEFSASQSAPLTGIWFYSAPGATALPSQCGVFRVSDHALVASNVTPTWSGAAGSGWVKCTFDGTVTLAASTSYKAAVYQGGPDSNNDWYPAVGGFFADPFVHGIFTAPASATADAGNGAYFFNGPGLTYPTGSFNQSFYGIDVEVTTGSGGTALVATPADAVGVGDIASAALDRTATASDLVGVADTATAAAGYARSQADAVGVTDAATGSTDFPRPLADPVGATDAVIDVLDSVVTLTEPVAATDTVAATATVVEQVDDTVSVSDAAIAATSFDRTLADPVGVTDSAATASGGVRAISDSVAASDAVAVDRAVTSADAVGVTDSATASFGSTSAVTASGVATSGGTNTLSSSLTVTLATSVAVGDVDLFAVNVQAAGVGLTTPSGWNLLKNQTESSTVYTSVYWRIRQSGDPTTVNVTITGATSAYSWVAWAFTGIDPVTPFGTPVGSADAVSDTTLNTPALTTTGTSTYRVMVSGIGSGSTTFTAAPSGLSTLAQTSAGKNVAVATNPNTTATTVAASSWTTSLAARGTAIHFEVLASVPAGLTRTVSDPVGASDAVALDRSTAAADPAGASDTTTAAQALTRAQSDAVGATDALALVRTATASETVGVTDTAGAVATVTTSAADQVDVSDSVSAQLIGASAASLVESVGVTDLLAGQQDLSRSPSDPVGVSDALSLATARALAEPVGATDAVGVAVDRVTTVVDPVTATDVVASSLAFARTLGDSAPVTDAVATDRALAQAEAVTVADAVAVSIARNATTTDGVGLADDVALTRAVAITDGLSVTDAVAADLARVAALSLDDALSITDAVTTDVAAERATTEQVDVSDAVTVTMDRVVDVVDLVQMADTVAYDYLTAALVDDGVQIADAVTSALHIGVRIDRPNETHVIVEPGTVRHVVPADPIVRHAVLIPPPTRHVVVPVPGQRHIVIRQSDARHVVMRLTGERHIVRIEPPE